MTILTILQSQPGPFSIDALLSREIANNSIRTWMVAIATAVVIQALCWLLRRLLQLRLARLAARTATRWDDVAVQVLADVRYWCVLLVSVYVASHGLELPTFAAKCLKVAAVVALALQLLLSSRLIIEESIAHLMSRSKKHDGSPDPSIASATTIIRFIATLVIGSLLILLALANLDVEITPLITGLGIGGIAIALAAQSILGDLFASLSILFDKPFLVGDAIRVGDQVGTVERIGIKSTLVRSVGGEIMVFRNTDLLGSRIHNFKQMAERRVVTVIGLVCETPTAGLRQAVELFKAAVKRQPGTRLDRCHFRSIGAYSLDLELVYFINSPDYVAFMDAQQTINMEILDSIRSAGLELAYPTQLEIQRTERQRSVAAGQ